MWINCIVCVQVTVKFAGHEVPKSPFSVSVTSAPGDASKVTVSGPGILRTGLTANKATYFDVATAGELILKFAYHIWPSACIHSRVLSYLLRLLWCDRGWYRCVVV